MHILAKMAPLALGFDAAKKEVNVHWNQRRAAAQLAKALKIDGQSENEVCEIRKGRVVGEMANSLD